MDRFDREKLDVLKKLKECDKSKIGQVDKEVKNLIDFLNKSKDFYTTSSCSGRILLIELSEDNRKDKAKWLFISHDRVSFRDLLKTLKKYKSKREFWFKQEPLILHVCARNLKEAEKLMTLAIYSGFKKASIIALSRRVIVEIRGTDYISCLIGKNKKILVDENYLKELLNLANKKLKRNLEKKERFFMNARKNFK
jgi:tRNA wybutosine-synthesizing protein 3